MQTYYHSAYTHRKDGNLNEELLLARACKHFQEFILGYKPYIQFVGFFELGRAHIVACNNKRGCLAHTAHTLATVAFYHILVLVARMVGKHAAYHYAFARENIGAALQHLLLNLEFEACRTAMIEAMDDDLNTGGGIAALYDLIRLLNAAMNGAHPASAAAIRRGKELFDEITELFGFVREETSDDGFIKEIEAAIEARLAAKKAKNYAEADRIRAELAERGVVLEDTPQGTKYKIL